MNGKHQHPVQMHCCTANATQGFYYAWEAIVRHNAGVSTVNLLMNRFSPWLDIESYMPYTGKVVVKNKTSDTINIRIPAWINRYKLVFKMNGSPVNVGYAGRYAVFSGLSGQETITLEFPLEREKMLLPIPFFNCRPHWGMPMLNAQFKGSTCIGVEEKMENEDLRGADPMWIKLFNRPKYQSDREIMKKTEYYCVDNPIKWY